MSTNLQNFNRALENAATKIRGDMQKFHKQVCLEVLKRIVYRTPVDTGRARGNWQVEIGRSASGILEVEGNKNLMADLAMRNGISKLGDISPFSLVHITNNLEYIYYLEYDRRSKQSPEGMVEITLTELAEWLWEAGRPSLQFTKE